MSILRVEQITSPLSITGSLYGTSSWAVSASQALTASYALNVPVVNLSGYVTTSSFNSFTASYNTASFTGSFTGNLTGTSSWAQNYNETDPIFVAKSASLATTGSNVFKGNQTIEGNLFMSGSFRLIYNNDPTTNMLYGMFDGSTIHGPYYQLFGNQYPNLTQRGGAEFIYDIRNNPSANFHIASFNGSSWTQKFLVDDNGVQVTGSLGATDNVNLSGSINFDNGARIVTNLYGAGGVDIIAEPGGYAELASNNTQSFVWVTNDGAYVGTSWDTTAYQWEFRDDGYFVLPQVTAITKQAGILSAGDIIIQADEARSWRFASGSGKLTAPGAIEATSFTGSLQGTASWAQNAVTASYLNTLNQNLTLNGNVNINGTASISFLNVTYESASVIYSSGSNQFGDATNDVQTLIGTVIVSGSQQITGSLNAPSITGSLFGTASWANNALTSSTADNFTVRGNLIVSGNTTIGDATTDSITMNATTMSLGSGTGILNIDSNTLYVDGANNRVGIGKIPTTVLDISGSVLVTGSINISGSVTSSAILISGSGTQRLIVVGSGSAQSIMTVQGSQGELFSVSDRLSGSLLSVNDISGLSILEVLSDRTILMGDTTARSLNTTFKTTTTNSGSFTIYSVPTSSYDGIFMEYTARSSSNARAGQFMAMWSGSSVNYTDNSITDFGSTAVLMFTGSISSSNLTITGNVTTGSGWTIKAIIRSI